MAAMAHRMRILVAVLAAVLMVGVASAPRVLAKEKAKEKRPPPTELRIGRIHKPEACPRETKAGDRLSMHYTGRLYEDGTEFDSSRKRDRPFDFRLGAGEVIKGWDQGLVGMCVGEKRKLTIPYHLAYGEAGSPPVIPAKATLVFDVELVDILKEDREDL